ncbi:hypothetical protein D8770_08865 [Methylobacterium sp. DB1607]|nr:hypothetical protein [Methylobacterium sp. DB1607]
MTFDDDGPSSGAGALPRVHGAGGGGSSKGGGGSASSAPDTLFSTATVRLVDLLGEGEIVGVRGGLKGVYLNDVPVQNADDSFNFKGLTAEFRVGTPDQPYMAGYPDVQTPNNVGIKVNQATPVTVSISDTDVDRLRVTIQVPSLFLAKSDGSVRASSVSYRILARYSGGQWVNALGDQTITGKTTSGYFRSHEIALPINPNGASAPWQVQVVRLSPDTDDFNNSQAKFTNQSDLVFHSTTSIVDARFGYPHSALVGLTAQASSFGSSVPGRTYLVDGVLMPIPSNYDPVARTYSGVWDGTFKEGFSNNPAWALNLILRNDRFGLGEFIDVAAIDKWSLYEIARYCDVPVSDGKGGQEPRYVFNGAISTQQEAFELLQMIAQVFRGTVYWSSGTVTAAQDRPADPVLLVTEANALEGENGEVFSYASSGRRARHTVAIVAWNDPDNLYKQALEVVEDPEGVARYGYNPTKIDLLGCTSRGQAHRAGLWTLFTELHQTQVLTYRAGLDHAVIRPGDIVAVQDPQISNLDLSGRLKADATASRLVLDRPVTLASGAGYSISVVLPDGTVQEREIATDAGETDVVTLAAPLSQVPDPAAVWLITGPVEPQLFRIVSIREEEPHIYAVAALQHEPGKYATIDDGAAFEPSVVSEFPTIVLPPTNLSVRESQYTELGQPKQAITLSWTAGQPFNSVAYYVTVIRPSGATVTTRTASQSIDFMEAEVGDWTFVVTAIGLNGKNSLPAQTTYTLAGWAGQAPTMVAGLSVKGGGSTFTGRSCTVTWANQIAATVPPYPVRNAVYIFDASMQALVHREVLPAGVTEWTYDYFLNVNEGGPRRQFRVGVAAYSAAGDEGPPSYLTVSNPAPEIIVPTLGSTSEVLFVDLPKVADADFAGYLVWVSETPNINPLTAPSYDVAGNSFPYRGVADKTYYVRAAAYDAFSKNPADLNVSAELSKKLTILLFDPNAPAIPGQPTLVSNVAETAPDGSVTSKVTVAWPAVASQNLGYYETYLAEGNNPTDASYIGRGEIRGTTAVFAGLMPGRQYSFKVRAQSKNGFAVSELSPVLVFTAAANTTAPGNPTGATVTGGFERAFLTWVNGAQKDISYVEVWGFVGNSAAVTPPNGSTVARVAYPGTFYQEALSTEGTKTYWLRSANTSGTVATSYVRVGVATSAALVAAQIGAGVIDATKVASSLAVPTVVAALPTTKTTQFVTLSTDGKLYRWDAAQARYVLNFTSAEITGLTAAQIDSVSAAAVAGILPDAVQQQINLAKLAGTITSGQIGAGSVTFASMEAGLSPIKDVASLPAVSGYTGPKVVRLTTDGKLYRLVGSAWTAGVSGSDVSGTIPVVSVPDLDAAKITSGQIVDARIASGIAAAKITGALTGATLAAANLTGKITETQISDNSISTPMLKAGAVVTAALAAQSVTASKMVLIDTQNLLLNPNFTQGWDDWLRNLVANSSLSNAASGDLPAGCPAVQAAKLVRAGAAEPYLQSLGLPADNSPRGTPCSAGDQFYLEAWVYQTVAGPVGLQAVGYTAAHALTGGGAINVNVPANTWTKVSSTVGVSPTAVASSARITQKTDNSSLWITNVRFQRKNGAELIVDGTISARKLMIGATAANLIPAGEFLDGLDSYNVSESVNFIIGATGGPTGGKYLRISRNGVTTSVPSLNTSVLDMVPVEGGAVYEAACYIRANINGTTGFRYRLLWYDANKVATTAPGTGGAANSNAYTDVWANTQPFTTSWVQLSRQVTPPAAARYARFQVYHHTEGGADWIDIANVSLRRAMTATVIENGAITTDKLGANAVTAGKVDANAITAREILGGTITATEIAGSTITADKIAGRTITAGNLVAGTLTANEIATNAITSDKILAGSVISDKIAAGAITGRHLSIASANSAYNADFSQGFRGWTIASANPGGTGLTGVLETSLNTMYAPVGLIAIGARTSGAPTATSGYFEITSQALLPDGSGTDYTVMAGSRVEISFYTSAHRCTSRLVLGWYNAAGTFLSENYAGNAVVNAGLSATNTLAEWNSSGRVTAIVQVPANAAKMRVRVRAQDFITGTGIAAYIFIAGLMIAPATSATQTAASPYVPPSVTTIDGGNIIARTITAADIATGTLTANEIAGSTITGAKIAGRTIAAGNLVSGTITANEIATRTITADRIVSRSLTANEIVSGTITANEIAGNTITAAKIQGGAIGADQLAAGAVVTSKLAITGANTAFNPDLSQGTRGWVRWDGWGTTDVAALSVPSLSTDWCPSGFTAVYISYTKAASAASGHAFGIRATKINAAGTVTNYPVTENITYEISAFLSLHRCTGRLYIDWRGANGSYTGNTQSTLAGGGGVGGDQRTYPRVKQIVKAPAGSTGADIFFMAENISGDSPYIFVSGFMFAACPAGQTETSPYSPPSNTFIDGGNIFTNSLNANRIVANSITTTQIETGGIHADRIQANTITTNQIASGQVNADRLVSGSITSTQIAANTISAAKLLIGMRPMTLAGCNFEMQVDANGNKTGWLTWTAGYLAVLGDGNEFAGFSIAAGSIQTNFQETHVWWSRGATWFDARVGGSDVLNSERIPMAYWTSASGLAVLRGGTSIDGDKITTRSIKAAKIGVGEIQTVHMTANSISGDRIQAGTLAADRITTGTLTVNAELFMGPNQQTRLWSDGNGGGLRWLDWNKQNWRGAIGYLGPWTGDANDYGMLVWGTDGAVKFRVSNAQNYISGLMIGDAEITNAKIGNLQIGNEKVQSNAITQGVGSQTGAGVKATDVWINIRNPNTKVGIWVNRTGTPSVQDGYFSPTGVLRTYAASPGGGWYAIREIPNNFMYEYSPGAGGSFLRHMPGSDMIYFNAEFPGWNGWRVEDTSSSGSGAVSIIVIEFSK